MSDFEFDDGGFGGDGGDSYSACATPVVDSDGDAAFVDTGGNVYEVDIDECPNSSSVDIDDSLFSEFDDDSDDGDLVEHSRQVQFVESRGHDREHTAKKTHREHKKHKFKSTGRSHSHSKKKSHRHRRMDKTETLSALSPLGVDSGGKIGKLEAITVLPEPSLSNAIPVGVWSANIFDCFDNCVPNCCMVTFCPCISAAQIAARLGYSYTVLLITFALIISSLWTTVGLSTAALVAPKSKKRSSYRSYRRYTYVEESSSNKGWNYASGVAAIVILFFLTLLRSKVRAKFNLPGSCVGDCCVSCGCSCCSLAQLATHVRSYTPGSCSFGKPDRLVGYQV